MRWPCPLLLLFAVACAAPVPVAEAPAPPACPSLDAALASRLVALSLACVDREYPNKPSAVVDGDASLRPARELSPAFFGCFDWHSAVHGHWAMVRVLRSVPGLPEEAAIRSRLDDHLSPARLGVELAFLESERNRIFERPYGWAWLLRLSAELLTWDDPDAHRWSSAVAPLARSISGRAAEYLEALSAPVREGTHQNTAFAMAHFFDYAVAASDDRLLEVLHRRGADFFDKDRDCPTGWEPSGEDFLSPCLAEADLMRRLLVPVDFRVWLDAFLPPVTDPRFVPLLHPPEVRDPKDPRIGHLIGLSFYRASALEGIQGALPAGDPRRGSYAAIASAHCTEAFRQMDTSGYGGEHWLATFAITALTAH